MNKLFHTANIYMILGLISGLFYREYTNIKGFHGDSQLSTLHTHILALGMLFFLIALVLDKVFTLSGYKMFTWFFWTYNAGLILTVVMMLVHGIMTVEGAKVSGAVPGIAGLGHIILTVGLILFFHALQKGVRVAVAERKNAETSEA
ncbi:MAG TPA: DUF2871 domain-containing protein [Stackebrandtia sp.]|jgi:uncharacterized integral membrane protein|uniref:DUF2871 domain-containing protein n=1 Tax=Stackebrandtia sp. TaxID=2023065 RepID=UPI002D4C54FD|nr:DUF2871 domain-containing protein [Stackebrandtia sp.]HZE38684.1 DUF2871 domain-containing protein [Stackebrandtia sp.]